MQKKTLHPPAADFQLKKKEKREKENEEGRKLRPTAGLDLAGHQDPQLGLVSVFLGFFSFRWVWFFSLVLRMIKSQKGLIFLSKF
jgi:hypothetical protein